MMGTRLLCRGMLFLALMGLSLPAWAAMGDGLVSAKSKDVNIEVFGSLKSYPHFIENADLNEDNTKDNYLLDESGLLDGDDITVRNEFRLGFAGGGQNWSFFSILEADFALDKDNTDRGARGDELPDVGMTGDDFGLEKLEFSYDFTDHGLPVTLMTGWNTKFLDIETGGLVYGDDHPYIGLKGKMNDIRWEALTMFVYDEVGPGLLDDDTEDLDWQVYSIKANVPVSAMHLVPFYAFSDNNEQEADVHYFGLEAFGEVGMWVPRLELVYATGEKDDFLGAEEADISAYAAFASLEAKISPAFRPYVGGYYISGDDDAHDEDIEAFNPITNISRYTPTFGMENAIIYRMFPVIGSHLYSNTPDNLGENPGYGGISNASSADSPGMVTLGVGAKGSVGKWSYKGQLQYFWLAETGAMEDSTLYADDIDDALGLEGDLQLTYSFNKHFSLGNVLSMFDPGDAVEDIRGEGYDEAALVNTVEMVWNF